MQGKESYWQREASWRDRWHEEPVPSQADFVIVGGGFSGLATAIQLREQNPAATILVLEAERVGYGASGRNAGFLSPVAAPIWLLGAERSPEHAWAVAHINRRMHETAAWFAEHIPGCEIARARLSIEGAGVFSDAGLREFSRALGVAGLEHSLAASRVHSDRLSLEMDAHNLHPYRLVQGLATHARLAGVQICERRRVLRIETTSAGARLALAGGHALTTGQAILCTNAYTRGLDIGTRIRALSVHSFMAATVPLEANVAEGLTRDADFSVELNSSQCYHRFHDGRILYGGTDALRAPKGGDFAVPARVRLALGKHLQHSYPGLHAPAFSEAWSGRLHATATGLPIIGRSTKNPALTLNVGYGGTGVALAFIFAPMVAAIAAGRSMVSADDRRLNKMLQETRVPFGGSIRAIGGVLGTLARPWLASIGLDATHKHL